MSRLQRRSAQRRVKRLFVVSTEGYRTEPIYLDNFNPDAGSGKFRIQVLNHRTKNDMDDIFGRLIDFRLHAPGVLQTQVVPL